MTINSVKTVSKIMAGAALALATASGASAAELDFSGFQTIGTSSFEAFWRQSSNPTPSFSDSGLAVVNVQNGQNAEFHNGVLFASDSFSEVNFFTTSVGSTYSIQNPIGGGDFGPQVFSGPTSAPLFAPGVYAGRYGTLTISAIPEPAAWSLMLVGVAGLGGALRAARRRVAAVVA